MRRAGVSRIEKSVLHLPFVAIHMRKWSGEPFLSGKIREGMVYCSLMRQKADKS